MTLKKALKNVKQEKIEPKDIFADYLRKEDGVGAFLSRPKEPLDLLPIAVKDNILVKGRKCTAGSKVLENYQAPYSATVIGKMKKAGLGVLGKTNMDEFAMGSSTENSAFQKTFNPHDHSRVPGGTSGGSAAAVAEDLCLAALGSDTGGSIRQPASFCGAVGLKPTYGAVSRYGLIATASSLDQIGTLTKTVADAKILFDIIGGKDKKDSTSLDIAVRSQQKQSQSSPADLTLGLPKEFFAQGLDPEIDKLIRQVVGKIEKKNIKVKEVSLPRAKYALSAYYLINFAEISANLARFDGIRYGQGRKNFGPEVKRRLILGTYVLSAGYYDAYYKKAQKVRTLIKQDFEDVFEQVDLLISPTSPTTAFKFGEKTGDPLTMYLSDVYTVPPNLAGLPAMSLPCGKIDNLPVGLQIIGPHFGEEDIFKLAVLIEGLVDV